MDSPNYKKVENSVILKRFKLTSNIIVTLKEHKVSLEYIDSGKIILDLYYSNLDKDSLVEMLTLLTREDSNKTRDIKEEVSSAIKLNELLLRRYLNARYSKT